MVVVGQVSSVVLGVMLVRILTEYLNPAEYGELSLILTLGVLVCVIPSAYFLAGIERMYSMAVEKKEEFGYYSAIKKMAKSSGLLSLIIVALLFIILKAQYPMYWEWREAIFLATLFTIVSGYSTALTSIFNAARERGLVAFYIFTDSILKIVLVLMLAYLNAVNVYMILLMYVIVTIITLIMRYRTFLKKISKPFLISGESISTPWKDKMYQYSKPFVYFQLFTWMHTSSDKWALEVFSSTESTGLLVVLMQVGYAPTVIVSGIIITYITPILYNKLGRATIENNILEAHNLSIKITNYILLTTIIFTMIAYFFHGSIFNIMTNDKYHSISYLMPWIVFSGGLFSAGQMLATKLSSELRINELIKPKIVTALIGIVFNMIGAYLFAVKGVVYGLTAFSVFYFIWMLYLSRHDKSLNNIHGF